MIRCDEERGAAMKAGGGARGIVDVLGGHDWAASALGPVSGWPVALRTLVDVMSGSQQPMFLAWGPELTLLYNAGYSEILGGKHPAALGRPFLEVWPEIRDDLVPLVAQALAGHSVHMDDIALVVERRGYPEEAHFAFSYTPVRDGGGDAVAGFFCACAETTAQVLAERRLREAEAEARGVLDGMGEGFLLLDRDFQIRRVNEEALRIDGRGRDAIIGRHLLEVWPESDQFPAWPLFQRVMADRVPGQVTYRHVSETHDAWFEVRCYPSGGGVAVFYRDVTSARRADDALRDSEAQFRALAQAVPNHAWTAAPDGGLTWFNQQVFAYSGLGHAALAGQGWTAIVHPHDVPRAGAAWAHSLASGEAYETEFRIRRADGAYRWHLVRAQPIRGEDGAIFQWAGTNTDIEEQRAATEGLAALNAELERRVAAATAERNRLWELSEDLLVVADYEGRLLRVSPSWTRLLGHDEPTLLSRPYDTLVHPDDFGAVMDALTTMRATGRSASFEDRLLAADGTWRWVAWTLSPDPGGQRLSGVGRDVTAAKARVAELEAAQEALRQSQKMEAVGQLTGGLAHDFNNLLTGITGSLELLQVRASQGRLSEVERYVGAAQGAAKRAAALTHRLLAFSRRQTLDPKPVDLNRLVSGMAELVGRTVGPAIRVEVRAAEGLWTTLVDSNQLENALLNLCINARDAMPNGGWLVIETSNQVLDGPVAGPLDLPAGAYVALAVSDSGVGMSAEVKRRAFDPFFTTKPIGQGTGLGLSMIYGFVQQSGGQARIRSAPGEGTEVRLYLPRHDALVAGAEAEEAAVPAQGGQGETVLVVDDEPTVRMLVAEVLQELGYTALEAADGLAGLEVLRSDARVDLLVTDVGLPGGLNGRQVADAGRALRPGLPVLFITGYAEHAVLGEGQLEPGMHVMPKPFGLDELAVRIREILAGTSG